MNCANCSKEPGHGTVMIGMTPGKDGKPWCLCWTCYAPSKPAVRIPRPAQRPKSRAHDRGGLL